MKKDQLIHIRLEPDEAIDSRRDVLNTEVDLIKIAKAIRKYRILRLKELQLKIDLYKKTKEFKLDMNKLKLLLPKHEIPKLLKKHEELMHNEKIEKEVKKIKQKTKKIEKKPKEEQKHEDNLEKQLREIQDKLNSLG